MGRLLNEVFRDSLKDLARREWEKNPNFKQLDPKEKERLLNKWVEEYMKEHGLENSQPQAQNQEVKDQQTDKSCERSPQDRDDILLEILKELKSLNSNVKALTVRIDTDREEARKFREKVIELLEIQVDKPF